MCGVDPLALQKAKILTECWASVFLWEHRRKYDNYIYLTNSVNIVEVLL